MAAESASMQAAGSGGSFGGSANLANRRYYDKTFVPAVTQMKTNQANDLASARQANDDLRNNLNTQLANMQTQANQQALSQYYADLEAEKEREFQAQQAAANRAAQRASSNPWAYMDSGYGNTNAGKNWNFGNGYYIQEFVDNAGNHYAKYYGHGDQEMDAGDFVWETNRGGTPWNIWNDIWDNGVNTYGINSNDITKLSNNGSIIGSVGGGGGGW